METYAKNEIEKKYQRDIEYSLLNGLLTGDELSKAARMLKIERYSSILCGKFSYDFKQ